MLLFLLCLIAANNLHGVIRINFFHLCHHEQSITHRTICICNIRYFLYTLYMYIICALWFLYTLKNAHRPWNIQIGIPLTEPRTWILLLASFQEFPSSHSAKCYHYSFIHPFSSWKRQQTTTRKEKNTFSTLHTKEFLIENTPAFRPGTEKRL